MLLIDNFLIERMFFYTKRLSIINFTNKLLSIKECFLHGPCRKITKKFIRKFVSKDIKRQYFHRKTGLKTCFYATSNCKSF